MMSTLIISGKVSKLRPLAIEFQAEREGNEAEVVTFRERSKTGFRKQPWKGSRRCLLFPPLPLSLNFRRNLERRRTLVNFTPINYTSKSKSRLNSISPILFFSEARYPFSKQHFVDDKISIFEHSNNEFFPFQLVRVGCASSPRETKVGEKLGGRIERNGF